VRPSPIQGLGAFTIRPIARGTRIIEYTGERLTDAEADARHDDAAQERHHTFLFAVGRDTVIDAAAGGAARYLNHSCEPNCAAVIERGRVYLEAIQDIGPGTELTYDYGMRRLGTPDEAAAARYACRCGARRCRGTILSPSSR
jgi:hypothetical protein